MLGDLVRRGKCYVWASWLPPYLIGSRQCRWWLWFRSHYQAGKRERDGNLARWIADHNEMIQKRVRVLEADGWECSVENQNAWKWHGSTAIVSGKIDIICRKPENVLLEDCKTGQPKDEYWWQVAIYLVAWPRVTDEKVDAGFLVYADGSMLRVDETDVTAHVRERIFALIREAASETAPQRVPSRQECEFCDCLEQDCPDRWTEPDEPLLRLAEEF